MTEILPTGKPNFSLQHRLIRLAWTITWLFLASWTPKQLAPWRRFLLRLFGAKLSNTSDVRGTAKVWYPANLIMEDATILAGGVECYNMALITIRRNSIISQRAFLCGGTHDFTLASHPLVTKTIEIGPNAWIAAEAFIGPGSIVAEGCVIGARSVVSGRLAPWGVYAGNPATRIKDRPYNRNA